MGIKLLKNLKYEGSPTLKAFLNSAYKIQKDYKFDGDNMLTIQNCIKWLYGNDGESLKQGLYIYGSCGTGKTLLMKCLKQFSLDIGQRVMVNNKDVRLYWKTYNANELCTLYQEGQTLTPIFNLPVLGIEDIGTESPISLYMGNRKNVLKELIEVRADKELLTFFTSNLNPYSPEFEEIYGKRAVSRISAMEVLELQGKDRRNKNN